MQSLQYSISGSQTIAVWPDVTASFAGNPSASYEMVATNDYGQQSTRVDLYIQNTPTRVVPRLVFSLNKAQLPSYTGNYTIQIKEGLGDALIWGQANATWGEIQAKWSATNYVGSLSTLDEDRAWISGSDVPSYTQYSSPNETGAYSIYQG